jgi:hypothetical protein
VAVKKANAEIAAQTKTGELFETSTKAKTMLFVLY